MFFHAWQGERCDERWGLLGRAGAGGQRGGVGATGQKRGVAEILHAKAAVSYEPSVFPRGKWALPSPYGARCIQKLFPKRQHLSFYFAFCFLPGTAILTETGLSSTYFPLYFASALLY